MRIALVVLGIAVLVYLAVRAVERRRTARLVRPPAPPVARSSPRAEQEFQRAVRERAERQRRGTPEPAAEPAPSQVVIDDDVFGPDEWGDPGSEHFVVTSPAPVGDVAAAVERASSRFMRVDELGREHPDQDAALRAYTEEGLYTPNYTADPVVTGEGVEGYVDCKGAIEAPMGAAFTRILREELDRLGTPAHVRSVDVS